ncbi:MAG: hypothetical protein FWC41_13105, partial [Firmicutes bacterium]|nr:hypothetical protein [Bacillota bacterium]
AMLFIIIFSLIYFAIELQIAFIVPITTILAVIIFEEGEQYYRLDRDSAKYGEYDQKMYDYIRHNDFNIEKIMDVLTDYSATTKLSSPIPSGLYGKLKDSLEKDWASRYDSLQTRILNNEKDNAAMPQLFFESAAKEFFSDKTKLEVIIDIILKDTGFDDVEKIDISKILGNSNNDVFSFVLQRRNSIDSIELFVKFYRDSQVFLKEKVALTKYAKKSDYFAKSIICDELEKYSCIVFYHVQSTSVEPFYSVSHIISNVDITKLDYQGKLKNISAAFSTIYKVLNNEKGIDSNAQNVDYLDERKPADLILDLEFFEYEIKGDNTIYLNSCKLTDVAFAEHCFIRQDTFKLEFSNWSTERTTVASTKINGHRIATILPRLNYGKTKINFSRLHGKNFLLSLENYLKIKGICEINISLSEKYENTINAIKSLKPQMVLCHNDFHAENLFVSEKSFKILDLSDVEYALKYTDVCRMQASLLQHFLKLNEGTDIADSFLLILKGKGNDNKIAEFIFQLKSAYDTTVDGNYKEYIYTLLVELILQCFYSICSSRCINEKWSKLLQDIAEMTEQ